MEAQSFNLISQNIASSKIVERILDVIKSKCPDILLLQEVTLKTSELIAALQGTQYSGQCNIDIASPSSPGTAVVWKMDLPNTQVTTLVTCQLQSVQIEQQTILNVYAPSAVVHKTAEPVQTCFNMICSPIYFKISEASSLFLLVTGTVCWLLGTQPPIPKTKSPKN